MVLAVIAESLAYFLLPSPPLRDRGHVIWRLASGARERAGPFPLVGSRAAGVQLAALVERGGINDPSGVFLVYDAVSRTRYGCLELREHFSCHTHRCRVAVGWGRIRLGPSAS